jgi:hypothetical protein
MGFFYGAGHKYVVNLTFSQTTTCKCNLTNIWGGLIFRFLKIYIMLLMNLGQFEMTKQVLLYYVHRNILMASFLYII